MTKTLIAVDITFEDIDSGLITLDEIEFMKAKLEATKILLKVQNITAEDCYKHINKAKEYIEEEINYRSEKPNIGKKMCLYQVNKAMELIKVKYEIEE